MKSHPNLIEISNSNSSGNVQMRVGLHESELIQVYYNLYSFAARFPVYLSFF